MFFNIDSDVQRICNGLNYNITCPCSLSCHIIQSSFAKTTVNSCFPYTTRDDTENAKFQERVYTNDAPECYIAGTNKQFPSPNTFTGTLPSSDNLNSNNEIVLTDLVQDTVLSDSSLQIFDHHLMLLCDELPILVLVHNYCNFVKPRSSV